MEMAKLDRSPHVAVLAAGIFVVSYGTNVSTPLLVLYKDRLNLTASQTMAIFVVYVAGILGTLLIAGPASDRFGRRPIVLPMVALSGVASLIMILGRDAFVLLLLGRFLLGVVSGGVLGVSAAWLLELLGRGHEQRAAVTTMVVTFGGFGIGPPVSALFHWLLPDPLVWPFVLHAAVTALVVVLMLRVPETRVPSTTSRLRPSLGVPSFARRPFFYVIVPAALWTFCFPSTSFALFPVLLIDALDGGEVAVAAAAGALTAWAGLGARPLVERIGARASLSVGMLLGVAGYVSGTVAFMTDSWPLVLVAAPLLGGAAGALTAGALTLLGEMADDESRGALTSTFYLVAYPGMAMPLLVTSVASVSSMSLALTLLTVTALIFALAVGMAVRSRSIAPA